MKETICTATGMLGAVIAALFGGWDAAIITLIIFMCVDYISGLICAGVFKSSPKTESGALESKAGWRGLCKKGMILVFVLIAARLDLILQTTYIRDAVCIGFIANELLSIVENAGLMGVPLPAIITKAMELLRQKGDTDNQV